MQLKRNYSKDLFQNLPKLTREERKNHLKKAKKGNKNSQEIFLLSNMALVKSIAGKYSKKYNLASHNFEELVQEGYFGLEKAYKGFKTSFKTEFSTYATYFIKSSIIEAIQKDVIIKIPLKVSKKYNILKNEISKKLENKISYDETNIPEESIPDLRGTRHIKKTIEREGLIKRENLNSLEYKLLPQNQTAEKMQDELDRTFLIDKIAKFLDKLDKRYYQVLFSKYVEGKSWKEIGDSLELSHEAVRQISKRAIKKTKAMFGDVFEEKFNYANERI